MNTVLILGKRGQLASALRDTVPAQVELICWGSEEFDLRNLEAIASRIADLNVDAVINASAWTAVDLAETEKEAAYALNHLAVEQIAKACEASGKYFLHVSTDFVFDGEKNTPYGPEDECKPLGVYGASKLAGEQALRSANKTAAIVRTAWVYSRRGSNFARTMLKLMQDRDELSVVSDQIGTPTSAYNLAEALWQLAAKSVSGIWHYTDSGVASWYDFAMAIEELGFKYGLLKSRTSVIPIPSTDYPTPAKRPSYSVLDNRATRVELPFSIPYWRTALEEEIKTLAMLAPENSNQ